SSRGAPRRASSDLRMGGPMAEKDKWIVKCPKCGRINQSCQHISRQDVERIVQLLKAGVEVYESEEEMEHLEDHLPRPDRGKLYALTQPRFALEDVVMGKKTREAIEDALVEIRNKGLIFQRWGMKKVIRKNKGLSRSEEHTSELQSRFDLV